LKNHPGLTQRDFEQAQAYALAYPDEIDGLIGQNEQQISASATETLGGSTPPE